MSSPFLPKNVASFSTKPSRGFEIYDYKIKPTYNVGDFGEDVKIPFDQDTLTGQTFTISSATFARHDEHIAGVTYFPVDDHTTAYSDSNTGVIIHEGNDTAFNRLYVYTPDMDVVLYKLGINMAFGLNVSSYGSGNFSLTSVRFLIYALGNNFNRMNPPIMDKTITSGLGNLGATGSQLFIVNEDVITDVELNAGQPVVMQIIVTCATGTGTRQEGIVPWFPYQAVNAAKTFSRSEMELHLHAAVSHADKALRRQRNEKKLDYSGISVEGVNQG